MSQAQMRVGRPLTPSQRSALFILAQFTRNGFDGMGSSSEHPKRVLNSLVKRGLLIDGGIAVICDGDGFTVEPERERPIWKLTGEGARYVETHP